jgi:hypothetical protein
VTLTPAVSFSTSTYLVRAGLRHSLRCLYIASQKTVQVGTARRPFAVVITAKCHVRETFLLTTARHSGECFDGIILTALHARDRNTISTRSTSLMPSYDGTTRSLPTRPREGSIRDDGSPAALSLCHRLSCTKRRAYITRPRPNKQTR